MMLDNWQKKRIGDSLQKTLEAYEGTHTGELTESLFVTARKEYLSSFSIKAAGGAVATLISGLAFYYGMEQSANFIREAALITGIGGGIYASAQLGSLGSMLLGNISEVYEMCRSVASSHLTRKLEEIGTTP